MNDQIFDTLRLSQDQLDELMRDSVEREGGGNSDRRSRRWSMQQQKAIVTIIQDGGRRMNLVIVPRNLSAEGVGFFYGGFIHTGTKCVVTLRAINGRAVPHRGRIMRCIHKKDHLHEIGVLFEEPIIPRDYFISVGDSPLFNAEAVDISRLRGTALLACHSPAERALIGDMFSDSGMLMTEASCAEEAIDKLVTEDPDILFADSDLPDMDWVEFVRTMRDNGFAGPIILLCSEHDQETRMAAIAAGANEMVFKPLTANMMHRAAAEYLIMASQTRNAMQPLISTLSLEEFSREVIVKYIDELQEYAVEMHHAIKEEDYDALGVNLKRIAGTAAEFGFPTISDNAREALNMVSESSQRRLLRLRSYEVMKMCRKAEAPLEKLQFSDEGEEAIENNGDKDPMEGSEAA